MYKGHEGYGRKGLKAGQASFSIMKKFKINPNTVLILIILAMVLLANIVNILVDFSSSDVASVKSYRDAGIPLNILDLIKIALIFFMGWNVYLLIKKVAKGEKWNAGFYTAIKRVGWMSILVLLFSSFSFVVREQYLSQNKNLMEISSDPAIYTDVISYTLFSSPIAWFLIAVIFITADILDNANRRHAVND